MIDIHNHVLFNVDDGPKTVADSLDLLKQAIDNGTTDIIVTPHQYSGDFVIPGSKIYSEVEKLKHIIEQHNLSINVYPGQEIRIHGELVAGLKSGHNIPLNQSQYVLIEFSYGEIASYTESIFFDLQMEGYIPIIAHPERCKPLMNKPELLYDLISKGSIAQVTAASVAGALGEVLQKKSLELIEYNLVHILASDAHHATLRPFMLKEAYEVIKEKLGQEYVTYFKQNAEAIVYNKTVKVKAPVVMEEQKNVRKRKKFLGLF